MLCLILYFAGSFAIGLGCLGAAIFLFLRRRQKPIKAFILFHAVLTANFLINFINLFLNLIGGTPNPSLALWFGLAQCLGQMAAWYLIPLFFLMLTGQAFHKVLRMLIVGLLIAGLVWLIVILTWPMALAVRLNLFQTSLTVFSTVKFPAFIWLLFHYLRRRNLVWGHEARLAVTASLWSSLAFPIIFIEIFLIHFSFSWQGQVISVAHLEIYYLVWSLLALVVSARYFLHRPEHRASPSNLSEFSSCHGLSERETEIVGLMVGGAGNQEIADRLFVSLPTVKTHVQNIYKKTSVNSRAKLLALLAR